MPEKPIRFSSLRVVREVEPTADVIRFHERVRDIGLQVFGAADQTYVKERASIQQELQPGFVAAQSRLPISAATVYPATGLRLVQFERRAPHDMNMGSGFERAKTWVRRKIATDSTVGTNLERSWLEELKEAAEKHGIQNRDRIGIYGRFVISVSNPDYTDLGREFAIVPDESPETEYLYDEKDIVHAIVKGLPRGRRNAYPVGQPAINHIAFARAPVEATDEARDDFITRVTEECGLTRFMLGPLVAYDR